MDNNNMELNTVETAPAAESKPAAPAKKNRRILKSGSYTVVVSAIVIAVVIAVNFFASVLPQSVMELDLTKESIYTIGDTTKQIVGALEEEVTLYYICEEGNEDSRVDKMIGNYEGLSDKLTVTRIDPAVNPDFVGTLTSDTVTANSVIAVSEKRTTVAAFEDFIRYDVEGYSEMSSEEFDSFYQQLTMQYYYTGEMPSVSVTELYYGEQYITSAIAYVTAEDIPALYYTTGHGETELSSTYVSYVTTENYQYGALTLLNNEIPEDAEAIMIINPTMDFTEAEVTSLLSYIQSGGDVILITSYNTYSTETRPNLAKLCAAMGLQSVDGLVMEGDSSHYFQYPNYLIPIIGATDESSPASRLETTNMYTLMPAAHGIISPQAIEGVTTTQILSTTDKAYLKTVIDENTTYEMQEGDVAGQYAIAAASSVADGGKFVWYASPYIVDENADSSVGKGNSQLFIATLNWMAGKMEAVSIIGKDISVKPLVMPESTVTAWKTFLCVIVPVAIAGTGLAVWSRRRRR